eukprot:6331922-Alexandrium_andersonii.AAC.2
MAEASAYPTIQQPRPQPSMKHPLGNDHVEPMKPHFWMAQNGCAQTAAASTRWAPPGLTGCLAGLSTARHWGTTVHGRLRKLHLSSRTRHPTARITSPRLSIQQATGNWPRR